MAAVHREMSVSAMDSSNTLPEAKRRRIRKGTRSCWECRGRKVKCTFMTPDDTVCDGCIRRGTSCISQELPEHPLGKLDRKQQMGNRLGRVEALLGRLVKDVGSELPASSRSIPEAIATSSPSTLLDAHIPSPSQSSNSGISNQSVTTPLRPEPSGVLSAGADSGQLHDTHPVGGPELISISPKHQVISQSLLAAFPSQDIVNTVVKMAGPMPTFFHQRVRRPVKHLQIDEKEKRAYLAELTVRHPPQTHPVIIARQMLLLAICFRYIHPSSLINFLVSPEPPRVAMQRVADAAIDMIETNHGLLNSTEGIECLLLASTLHADSGNLRSGWASVRRAMLLGQLMSLHRQTRLPPKSMEAGDRWDPQFLWHRIVYFDRFMSLVLGLPQGSTDNSMASPVALEADTPEGRLRRWHCVLAGRILQRNESNPGPDDFDETLAIDEELQRVAASMPGKWWLVPNLALIQDNDVELYWGSMRLTDQVYHNVLLTQLHLPFMLHFMSGQHQECYEYSRVACVNAGRDLLQRCVGLRSFSRASYCCHSMDFFAITASMLLLLAHLDARRSNRNSDKALLHQRTSDRAMIEEILDNMEQVGTFNKENSLSERGAGVLRRLLAIEASAITPSPSAECDLPRPHEPPLRLIIPSFGVLTVAENGCITQERQEPTIIPPPTNIQPSHDGHGELNPLPASGVEFPPQDYTESLDGQVDYRYGQQASMLDFGFANQLNWSIQDAHSAFLNSMMEPDVQGDGFDSSSWWLL